MKTAVVLFGLVLQPAVAHAQDFAPFAGGSPAFTEAKAMFEGKPVTIVRITAYFHQMDLPAGSVQPIGLEEFKFFIKDPNGNMARCEKWVTKVRADEAAWSKTKPTFPYLEINIAQGAKPVTVNGLAAYRGFDVRCWEAMDFGPPLF